MTGPLWLLVLAPASRIDEGPLWDELEERLRDAGHKLRAVVRDRGLVTAAATVDQRRLMLASWDLLLGRMAQRTKEDGDGPGML